MRHGRSAPTIPQYRMRVERHCETIASKVRALVESADIIVTTYKTLSAEKRSKTLSLVHWRRVVLDEMQAG